MACVCLQSSWFRKSRFKGGKGKSANTGGKGFGFRERDRPGLGSDDIEEPSSRGSSGAASGDVMGSLGNMSKMGPGQGRLAAMKAAFKAQYQAQFKASEDHTWEQTRDTPAPSTSYPPPSYNCPPPPPVAAPSEVSPSPSNREKKKKSRWDK